MTHKILGLNEGTMIDFINRAQSGEVSKNEVYKGTRFGRKSYNIFSLYAMLLKKGLPAGIDVHIGVKWKWEHTDLERYIVAIQKALGE